MTWGDGGFRLPNGDLQLLPWILRSDSEHDGVLRGDLFTIARKARELTTAANELAVSGFLTTAYGLLDGDKKRRTMVLASRDGDWQMEIEALHEQGGGARKGAP